MKKALTTFALVAFAAAAAQAQYSFTSVGQTVTEDFTGYAGAAAPTNWTLDATNRNGGTGGQASFQGNQGASTTGGWRSYGAANATDRSLGFLGNGNFGGGNGNGNANNNELNLATMTATFQNNTGVTLDELVIGYTGEQWLSQTSRTSLITVSYSTDGTSFTNIGSLQFNAISTSVNASLDGEASGNRMVFSPADVTGLNIAAGNNFFIRWTYNGDGGAGSRQGLSIDDVNVQVFSGAAIPEPATVGLVGLGLAGMLLFQRSRRSRR